MNCGTYSLDSEEVSHDGTILRTAGFNYEDITCKVSFDIIIEIASGTKFTGNISLDMPVRKYINRRKIKL